MPGDRVVPELAMDTVPISRLDELHAHLEELGRSPETPINARLFDEVELQLTGNSLPSFSLYPSFVLTH